MTRRGGSKGKRKRPATSTGAKLARQENRLRILIVDGRADSEEASQARAEIARLKGQK